MERFNVSAEIWERFAGMRIVVAVVERLSNRRRRPEIEEAWREAWEGAAGLDLPNPQSHPRIGAWRDAFRALGVSRKKYPSSVEAVLRRALKGGEPFAVNPLVDFYNAVSLRHLVPAGGFDLDELAGPLELRLSRQGDTFAALDAEAPEPVAPGEVSYAAGSTVLTRHFVWRQARTALITPSTRRAILVSEVLGGLDDAVAAAVEADFSGGVETAFGVRPRTFVATGERPSIEW